MVQHMDERGWLAYEDSAPMMRWLIQGKGNLYSKSPDGIPIGVSLDKLRRFSCACMHASNQKLLKQSQSKYNYGEAGETIQDLSAVAVAEDWAVAIQTPDPSQSVKAQILKDTIGNPIKPVSLCGNPDHGSVVVRPCCMSCQRIRTPTVVSLAEAAYREIGTRCDVCNGAEAVANHRAGEVRGSVCQACCDTGVINNGQLDPFRLALVADALEEAGCTVPALLKHLRGWQMCWRCLGEGAFIDSLGERGEIVDWVDCYQCDGAGYLKIEVPFYRGMWSLDLTLGRE